MEVKATEILLSVTIETTPEELEDLDRELNRFYEIANEKGEQFHKVWELKDKLTLAVKG